MANQVAQLLSTLASFSSSQLGWRTTISWKLPSPSWGFWFCVFVCACRFFSNADSDLLLFDILPTSRGFLDANGIRPHKCRTYDTSPKKVDVPTFKLSILGLPFRESKNDCIIILSQHARWCLKKEKYFLFFWCVFYNFIWIFL